jgi:hypothetical protein
MGSNEHEVRAVGVVYKVHIQEVFENAAFRMAAIRRATNMPPTRNPTTIPKAAGGLEFKSGYISSYLKAAKRKPKTAPHCAALVIAQDLVGTPIVIYSTPRLRISMMPLV